MDEATPLPEPDRRDGAPHPRETSLLFGQDKAALTFLEAVRAGRLHHGWLIQGPNGIGKATLAWRIARFLIAGRSLDGPADPAHLYMDPEDPLFRRMAALGEPRLALVRRPYDHKREVLRGEITIDEIRKLGDFFHLSAADGGWRVAIVDAADEMNINAANALLKHLEEPPERTVVLLISHQPGRLLPTIKSRCRTLTCEPLAPEPMALALDAAGATLAQEDHGLLQLASGSVGEALALASMDGLALYGQIVSILESLPRMDRGKVLALADAASARGAAARYALTVDLVALALSRLAKTGASGTPPPEAIKGEGSVLARLAPSSAAGQIWAELAQVLLSKTTHARAVNLDPSSVILDMFLQIEARAARII